MNSHKQLFIESFPFDCHQDVEFVYDKLNLKEDETKLHLPSHNYGYIDNNSQFHRFLSRCFISNDVDLNQFSQNQQLIIHCIFSQHYNGFIREKHLKALDSFDGDIEIAIPFIMAEVGNYVYEIQLLALDVLINHLQLTKEFVKRNKAFWRIQQSRVSAVWSEHYRGVQPVPKQWKTFRDYPVRSKLVHLNRLLIEC